MSQSLTIAEARDEITKLFDDAWQAMTPPLSLTEAPLVIWDDTKVKKPTDADIPWARFTIRHNLGGQATLGDDTGTKLFDRLGVFSVQIFTPRGFGLSLGDALSKIALDAFEGKHTAGGVWFKNVTPNEVPEKAGEPWIQVNVTGGFAYTERK